MPPAMQGPDTHSSIETSFQQIQINCTKLCSEGRGGAACNCGDMPPAFRAADPQGNLEQLPEQQLRQLPETDRKLKLEQQLGQFGRRQRKLVCRHLCLNNLRFAPKACRCHHSPQPPAATAAFEQPLSSSSGSHDRRWRRRPFIGAALPDPLTLCNRLCKAGNGGALCDCSNGSNMPPAMFSSSLKTDSKNAAPERRPFAAAALLPPIGPTVDSVDVRKPIVDCLHLCNLGQGGSLCDCGTMPPA